MKLAPYKVSLNDSYNVNKSDNLCNNDVELAETRRKIIALLKRHYPNKVNKIDLLLEKIEGNEMALLEQSMKLKNEKIKEEKNTPVSSLSSCENSISSAQLRSEKVLERHKLRMSAAGE